MLSITEDAPFTGATIDRRSVPRCLWRVSFDRRLMTLIVAQDSMHGYSHRVSRGIWTLFLDDQHVIRGARADLGCDALDLTPIVDLVPAQIVVEARQVVDTSLRTRTDCVVTAVVG